MSQMDRKFEERVEKATGIQIPKPTGPGSMPPAKAIPTFYTRLFARAKKEK